MSRVLLCHLTIKKIKFKLLLKSIMQFAAEINIIYLYEYF